MFVLGGKFFYEFVYVKIGEQFVCGCVWVYEVFFFGIMFEVLEIIFCFVFFFVFLLKDEEEEEFFWCKWDDVIYKDVNIVFGWYFKFFRVVQDFLYFFWFEVIEFIFIVYCIIGKKDLFDIVWCMFMVV